MTQREVSVVDAQIKVTSSKYQWKMTYRGKSIQGSGEGDLYGSRYAAALLALRDMLNRMVRPAVIKLQVNEMNLANYIQRGLPGKWKANGWANSHGVPVKEADLWKQINIGQHAIKAEYRKDVEL